MKKYLILALVAIAVLLPFSATVGQGLPESPVQGILAFSAWSDDAVSDGFNGGVNMGVQVPIATQRGMWLRLTYKQWNIKPQGTNKGFGVSILSDWYMGKKLTFYVMPGADSHIEGPLEGTDFFFGMGATRRLWTSNEAFYSTQAHLDVFAEVIMNDGSGQFSGNYIQLNVGIKFGRPIFK